VLPPVRFKETKDDGCKEMVIDFIKKHGMAVTKSPDWPLLIVKTYEPLVTEIVQSLCG
jgi:hypothetical protein